MANYSDSFTGSNSAASAGPNWTNKLNAMGILSNTAYPATGSSSVCAATYNSVMDGDDPIITATVGGTVNTTNFVYLFACSGSDIQCCIKVVSTTIQICTATAWNATAVQASNTVTVAAGDTIGIGRSGNVFTAYHNGSPLATTWNDTGNTIPRDSSHRQHGIGGRRVTGETTLDNYSAQDTGPQDVDPSGIGSGEGFGSSTVTLTDQYVVPPGTASAEAFGHPGVALDGQVGPTGIPSGEGLGNPTVSPGSVSVAPPGIGTGESFGIPGVSALPLDPSRARLAAGLDDEWLIISDSTGFSLFDDGFSEATTPWTPGTLFGWVGRDALYVTDFHDANLVVRYWNHPTDTGYTDPVTLRSSERGDEAPTLTVWLGGWPGQTMGAYLTHETTMLAATDPSFIEVSDGFNETNASTYGDRCATFAGDLATKYPRAQIVYDTQNYTTVTHSPSFASDFAQMIGTFLPGKSQPLSPLLQQSSSGVWVIDTWQAPLTADDLADDGVGGLHTNASGYKKVAAFRISLMAPDIYAALLQAIGPAGIGSGEAFGSDTVAPGAVGVSPTAIPSAEAFGADIVDGGGSSGVTPPAIPSGEAFGADTVAPGAVNVAPTGAGSGEAFGADTVAPGAVGVSPPGVGSAEAVGDPTVAAAGDQEVDPSGVVSGEAVGSPTVAVASDQGVDPAGVGSGAALGSPTVIVSAPPGNDPITVPWSRRMVVPLDDDMRPTMTRWVKDPGDVDWWQADFLRWLDQGETIISGTVVVDDAISSLSAVQQGSSVFVELAGGTAPTSMLRFDITTSAGNSYRARIPLRVQSRIVQD